MRTFLILAMLSGAATLAMAQGKTIPPPDDVKAAPADAKSRQKRPKPRASGRTRER